MTGVAFFFLLVYLSAVYVRPHEMIQTPLSWPIFPTLLMISVFASLVGFARYPKAPQVTASAGLFLAAFASVAFNGWMGGAVKASLDLLSPILVAYCISASVTSIRRLKTTLALILFIGSVLALHGIDQFTSGAGWSGALPVQDGRITYIGFMNDPNDLARVFVFCVPIGIYFSSHGGLVTRLLAATSLILIVVGIYLTSSRGAYLALITISVVVLVQRFGALKASLTIPFAIAGMLYLAPDRISEMSTEEASAAGRVDAWYAGIQMLRSHPLFGVGKGWFVEHHPITAHNSFILAFAEMGLFGYFFWFSLIYATYRMLVDLLSQSLGATGERGVSTSPHLFLKENRPLIRSLFAANAGLLVTALFLSRTYELTMYVGIGLVVALYQMALRQGVANLTTTRLWPLVPQLVLYAMGSIVAIWLLVRVLLLMN